MKSRPCGLLFHNITYRGNMRFYPRESSVYKAKIDHFYNSSIRILIFFLFLITVFYLIFN